MGQASSIKKINFEDIHYLKKNMHKQYYLISTLGANEQSCLITGTLAISSEVDMINKARSTPNIHIIIYGKNTNDESIYIKYKQLLGLGFTNIFIYPGGMFEWLCLQDIYGKEEFPTTADELDLLKFKPTRQLFHSLLLQDKS